MAVFSIVDVKMFVIRLVVFFLVLGVLIFMFTALGEITKGSELERKLNELGEAMLTSEFTVARAVFDPQKKMQIAGLGARSITDLSNEKIEPLRICGYLAQFEFLRYDAKKEDFVRISSFGGGIDYPRAVRDWTVWINGTDGLAPGIMRIALSGGGFARLACAVEQAVAHKTPTSVNVSFEDICGVGLLQGCSMSYYDKTLCARRETRGQPSEYCRYIGIELSGSTTEFSSRHHTVSIFPIKDVAGASEACPSPTTFQSDDERKQFGIKKVVICETHSD
ncbi:MAG: hypothetical protein QW548_03295 [Candidatus Aenigmatarchaeota archaeon]